MPVIRQLWAMRGPIIGVVVSLALLPLALSEYTSTRCGYVVLVMAALWLTEAIPIPVTALMPVFLFPMVGVLTADAVCKSYVNDTSMLFIGGLILAVAVEEWKLHKRIALGVLRIVGSDPKLIMLGLMLPTWFLSMWISNTATASMMIPIANAVLGQIEEVSPNTKDDADPISEAETSMTGETTKKQSQKSFKPCSEKYTVVSDETPHVTNGDCIAVHVDDTMTPLSNGSANPVAEINVSSRSETNAKDIEGVPETRKESSKAHKLLAKGLSLCIAYACNVGGIATLTGTPPNLVFKGIADEYFDKYQEKKVGSGVTFANWMAFALPMSLITVIFAWILLMILFLRKNIFRKVPSEHKLAVKRILTQEWKDLGRVSMAEIEVLVLFIILAVLWISRDPKESPGWHLLFMPNYVSDASAAMFISVLLFILPAEVPRVFCLRTEEHLTKKYYRPLLTWKQVHTKLPWGVIILLGGGFALAKACSDSKLSDWLGEQLSSLSSLEPWLLNLILCLVVAMATEVTSNTATSTLLMPIMWRLAFEVKVNPLYLMVSAAVATSFAFMLPVATPPNAIVFAYGHIRVSDMAFAGLFMNIIAVLTLTLAVNTWGNAIFGFSTIPAIFANTTTTA